MMRLHSTVRGEGSEFPGSSLFLYQEWAQIATRLALSQRELEVVQGIFDDLGEHEIAGRLEISTHTVHAHVERLYRKLGVASRVQLLVTVFLAAQVSHAHGAHG